jgi:ATP-binding cassette subfamily B protein
MHADNIIVLDQGAIAEQGRHEQLLSANGLYARLWRRQLATSEWKMSNLFN